MRQKGRKRAPRVGCLGDDAKAGAAIEQTTIARPHDRVIIDQQYRGRIQSALPVPDTDPEHDSRARDWLPPIGGSSMNVSG